MARSFHRIKFDKWRSHRSIYCLYYDADRGIFTQDGSIDPYGVSGLQWHYNGKVVTMARHCDDDDHVRVCEEVGRRRLVTQTPC
jgi:hypothetical protein